MLGKLMKYELKATSRFFLPLFGAMIAISFVSRLFQIFDRISALDLAAPRSMSIIIAWLLIIIIAIITLVITIQRFNKNLLQNEGYLTLTLPVKTESVILSKLFVSSIWYFASGIVITASIILLSGVDISFTDIGNYFSNIFSSTSLTSGETWLVIFELIVLALLSAFMPVLLIYTCLSLGMLVNNHRWLLSFGAFFVITTIMQLCASLTVTPLLWESVNYWSPFDLLQLLLLGATCVLLVHCTAFFFLTRYMLRYRLNLH